MAITGNWTLFYDWGSDGSYSSTRVTINAGGTLSTGGGYTGPWVQIGGMFIFTFNNSETTYSGNLASKAITGVVTTFDGTNGSFYMLQEGAPTSLAARVSTKADEAGK